MTVATDVGRIFAEPSAYADPVTWHATAARLRREAPICWVSVPDYPDFFAITKHADIMEIERNCDVFTNGPVPVLATRRDLDGRPADSLMKTLSEMDGDEHRAHRSLLVDWFKPGNVKRMSARVDELATRYVDLMADMDGACDFARDIAMHFPLQVILSILGIPEADYEKMLQLTQELFAADDPDIGHTGDDTTPYEVVLEFADYFSHLAADRRAHPTSDLASVIANAELNGAPLPDIDMFGLYLIVATAGHDTTSNSIAGALLALLEHPDQLDLLQSNANAIDHGADELLRHVSPVKHFIRHCQEPFTLRDVEFAAGDITLLSFASANRDEDVFEDPFRLDLRRVNASDHLAFGFGHHFCLGAHLARLEIKAIFRELFGRLEHIQLDREPTFVQSRLVSGPKTLPVTYQLS